MSARASATRCCSPPESSEGRCSSRLVRPSRSVMRLKCAGIAIAVAGDFLRDRDVRARVERGQQVEFLEDESDLALAHAGALGVGERGQIVAVEHDAAAIGLGQSAEKIEESGFSAARRSDDADELALLHAEGDAAQRLDFDFAHVVGLAQVFCFDECVRPCLIRILHEGDDGDAGTSSCVQRLRNVSGTVQCFQAAPIWLREPAEAAAACAWDRACAPAAAGRVPADRPERTFPWREKRRPSNRDRRCGPCSRSEWRESAATMSLILAISCGPSSPGIAMSAITRSMPPCWKRSSASSPRAKLATR